MYVNGYEQIPVKLSPDYTDEDGDGEDGEWSYQETYIYLRQGLNSVVLKTIRGSIM